MQPHAMLPRRWSPAGIALAALCLCLACSDDARPEPPVARLSVLAGSPSGQGCIDGPIATARFNYPTGIAVDGSGNVYVSDSNNSSIRKIVPGGSVSTLAGASGKLGSLDGTGPSARFSGPSGLAADAHGNLFVVDGNNHTIRKITPAGVVTTLAGSPGQPGSSDGTGSAARFKYPNGLTVDGSGNLYVADNGNNTIRKITAEGVVSTLAGTAGVWGNADGMGADAQFGGPSGLALDPSGNLIVAEGGNCLIRKVTPAGVVSTLAGSTWGYADGTGSAAQFSGPNDVTVDKTGNAYVTDTYGQIIRKVTPAGVVSTLAGKPGEEGTLDGAGGAARFKVPNRITIDGSGNLFVTDDNATVRKITPAGIVSTLTGVAGHSGSTDGPGASALFNWPNGTALDHAGNLFVADQDNSTIRKISAAGIVSTFAGTPGGWGTADGTGAEAQFQGAGFLTVDAAGNVFVADCNGQTIRKITPAGVVTTLAGSPGVSGSDDGTGADARFSWPNDLTVDASGNLYVADFGNNTIRKVTPAGVVTTLAGKAGVAGGADGVGLAATFNGPAGVAVDAAGNVYATDYLGHTIRKITPQGVVTTVAGAAGQCGSNDGNGILARFSLPFGLDIDPAGNLYVCDCGNNTIRKITPAGVVTTIVGVPGTYLNKPGVLPASLAEPAGVTVDPVTGNLYVSLPDAILKVTFK